MTDPKLTPPVELVREWCVRSNKHETYDQFWRNLATQAAQWGADQELEACIDWMKRMDYWGDDGKAIPALRAARRPKPQTLNSIALQMLGTIARDGHYIPEITDIIRQALEQLND